MLCSKRQLSGKSVAARAIGGDERTSELAVALLVELAERHADGSLSTGRDSRRLGELGLNKACRSHGG